MPAHGKELRDRKRPGAKPVMPAWVLTILARGRQVELSTEVLFERLPSLDRDFKALRTGRMGVLNRLEHLGHVASKRFPGHAETYWTITPAGREWLANWKRTQSDERQTD